MCINAEKFGHSVHWYLNNQIDKILNMKKFHLLFSTIVLCFLCACSRPAFEREDNSIVVYPIGETAVSAVKITPITNEIIKVESSENDEFKADESLVDVTKNLSAKSQVEELENVISVKTKKTWVKVDKMTGNVSFYNLNGTPIVKEQSKALKPMSVDGVAGYELTQVFKSDDDEALYGLGQHQADEINYKGKNEELFQYNTKVSVPFVVSTNNYGILWDNYSLSRFGDARAYGQLTQFDVYDKFGNEGGLTTTYIDDTQKNHVYETRIESTIDYENLETVKQFPEGFKFDKAKITWEGYIKADESGEFNFLLYYAGYTKLWLNDELQVDKWRTAWNPSVAKFGVDMVEGEKYHIKLEWIPDGGVSYIGLKALSPRSQEEKNAISFYSEMGDQIQYYFMHGKSMDDVISSYRTVTGKAQVMPRWAMGFWQSRERYKTQKELLNTLKEFRKRHIPIDNIVQDWSYWEEDQWGSHEFEKKRFPDPKGMIDEVHQNNARIMISVWPKFYQNTDNFRAFDAKGWMYTRAVNDSIRDWIKQGYIGSFYDAYSEGARKLFWEQIKDKLYGYGFDAWWMDASEPDIMSNASIEYRKALMNPTELGPSTKYFNAYALMNAKGIYEGQRESDPEDRVFILTRSGFAGLQNYGAATWSGDVGTCWEDMKAQVSAGINFGMSGLPYWTMDIGGFSVQKRFEKAKEGSEDMKEWRELNTRWYQFGTFVPLFRVHGQKPYREVFHLAPESHPAYKSMLYYNKLRYRLMPYIYSLTGWVYHNDYTIMRGLAMDFASDKNVWNIGDQYMFGPSLMVAPVAQYNVTERDVYLPKGEGWYNFYNGAYYQGGQSVTMNAPFERMPLLVKSGSIVPFGPEIEYTSQRKADEMTLYVYTGADANFVLYEDEDTNYNYETGKYLNIPFTYNERTKTLTVGKQQGAFEGMLTERSIKVVFVTPDNSVGDNIDIAKGQTIQYTGSEVLLKAK